MKNLKLLFLFCILIACEKETNNYPKVYIFDSYETGEVRIFTNTGEINNEQLSINFISKWSDYFYKEDSFKFIDFDFNGKITLTSGIQSTVEGFDTTVNYSIKQVDHVIYFESSDTAYSRFDLINMKDPRFLYSPITHTDVKAGGVAGFPPMPTYLYGYLPCIYALDKGQVIKIPFISFLEKNCTADTSWSIFGNCYNTSAVSNINNLFNESYLSRSIYNEQLNSLYQRRDTVVIQENYIVFRKL